MINKPDEEKWDIYNEYRQKLNKTRCRGENLQSGEYHLVVEIWTINTDNEILLTLRHPDKKAYPNYWENTGGSVLAGETSRQGAVRELFEETGIETKEDELVFLGTKKDDNIFFDIYMVKKDQNTITLRMQEGETVAAQWVDLETFDKMAESRDIVPSLVERLKPYREILEKQLFSC